MIRTSAAPPAWLRRFFALAALAAVLAPAGTAQAASIHQSVATLARGARSVVVARVAAVTSRESTSVGASLPYIVTDVDLVVEKYIVGSGSSTIRVTVPGGAVQGLAMLVDEAPSFASGQRCLVFLDRRGRVLSDRQGKLDLDGAQARGVGQSLATVESRIRRAIDPPTTDPWYSVVQELVASAPEAALAAASPTLVSITPRMQSAGTANTVTVAGSGFGSVEGTVTFYADPTSVVVAPIVSWSDSSIVCEVPSRASSGAVTVITNAGSSSRSYTAGFSYSRMRVPAPAAMSYRVNLNSLDGATGVVGSIISAMSTWNAQTPFRFSYAGATTATQNPPAFNARNDIYWARSGFEEQPGTLAWNARWYDPAHPETILESDIVFNDDYVWGDAATTPGVYDIETVMLHEMGHSLSLDDQYGAGDSGKVMYGWAGPVHRTLSIEDVKGIAWIYGAAPLAGATTFNGGRSATNTRAVQASSAWTGAAEMRFDSGAGFGAWVQYAPSVTLTLPSVDGTYTVVAEYRSALQVVSPTRPSAAIALDRVLPTTSASVAPTYLSSASITIVASDGSGSGVAWTDHRLDGVDASGTLVTTSVPGSHTLQHRAVDVAGNVGAWSAPQTFSVNTVTYTLKYAAGLNGSLSGTTSQTVNYNASGTAVTAVANTGYHFVNWSDGSTANPRTDSNVVANLNVTANFAINTYQLKYAAGANGSLSGTTSQTVNYNGSGTSVTANANTGYHFVNWSDARTANPRTDTGVTAPVNVTANFAIDAPSYTLTYTAGTGGTISGTTPQTVSSGGSGTAVTAVASTGYHFVSWSDASIANPRTDTNVTANRSLTASFAINTYTLTYTAGANGTITGTSPQTVNYNGSGTAVTAVANTGYHFTSWSDGWPTASRTDTNVTDNKSVTANFAADGTTPTLVPVYRFYNLKMGVHFYTASPSEMATVRDTLYRTYKLEGVAYSLNTGNSANNTPLHRFYNIRKGVHFYTASASEMATVRDTMRSTYQYEGVAYNVSPSPAGGATPVYRFYNIKQGVHFYTASPAEMATVRDTMRATYRLEGVGYYLAP